MALTSYSSAIEEIKSRCNIVDVVSPVVPLKKAGSNYKACCPFHSEKTPSFVVSEKKQMFTCFGCGASGDAVEFVKKYYNLSFPDAVRRLAQQYGVEIDDAYARQGKRKDAYYEINRLAARYFYERFAKEANPGYSYMKRRQIEPETLRKFGIGYAPDSWRGLTDEMLKGGAEKDKLEELGLCSRRNDGGLYDRFRGRVMFPIFNTVGKVIGFGGRIIGDGEPKYLNSQESLVFEKKKNLYGLNLTKGDIQNEGYAVLVEGYMDVIGLYQGGVKNVAASLGTALTPEQARLLKKYTKKVVICYDADAAGIKAAIRGCDVLREAGLDVRVMHVTDGKDPDDFIKKHGADEFRALVEKTAVADVEYKLGLIRRKYGTDDIGQGIKFLRAAASVLRPLSPVEADLYIRKVAQEAGVSEGALRREVEQSGVSEHRPEAAPRAERRDARDERGKAAEDAGSAAMLEKLLIRLCMQRADFWPRLRPYEDALASAAGYEIGRAMEELYRENSEFDVEALKEALSESAAAALDSVMEEVRVGDDEEEAFSDCLLKLQRRKAERRMAEIMDILSIAEGSDGAMLDRLMLELAELRRTYMK